MAIIDIRVPQLAQRPASIRLLAWRKEAGAMVAPQEVVAVIGIDTIVLELEAPCGGVLGAHGEAPGSTLVPGALLAQLDTAASMTAPRLQRRVPMSRLRQRIAERLVQSRNSSATVTTFNEVNMQPLFDLQRRLLTAPGAQVPGVMAFYAKAALLALARHPVLNAFLDGGEIVYNESVNLGIAVAAPRGLVVPVVRDADTLSLRELDSCIGAISAKANSARLSVVELEGGTFTISNGGVFGSMLSTPIINPPQSAILGVHATTERAVVEGDTVVIRPMNYFALSYDHRLVDGKDAVLGLLAIKEALEDPVALLLSDAERALLAQAAPAAADAGLGRPSPGWPASEQNLAAMLAESLAVIAPSAAGADAQARFLDLGLDSLGALAWTEILRERFGLALAPTMVYAYPCLGQLAAFLWPRVQAAAASTVAADAPSVGPVPSRPAPPALAAGAAVAIIGMAGRYPGAASLAQFWDNLRAGSNSVRESEGRWPLDDYSSESPLPQGKLASKWMGQLDDVDQFDPRFFGILPSDADAIDPQQRLFLQEAYRAIEDAGYAPRSLDGTRCGIYLGLCNNDYAILQRGTGGGDASRMGNSNAIASARLAYYLNLKGPAMTIDTACSSSLVAVHLARQALLAGETDLALAGGVSLHLAPELYRCWSAAGMLSPDGACKSFDDRANGFVPAEGVGAVVLKRLDDAERDGDNILAVLLGSAINQDGKTNGIAAPSMASQAELLGGLYAQAGVDPATIGYIEAHGTGTRLGDPIELDALATVFGGAARATPCALGSVKSNIGHAIGAAGIAGLHKVLLSMEHGELAPTLHFSTPNRHFDFAAAPFVVNTALRAWEPAAGAARRAGVNSFGVSGTNAHIVLEQYRAPAAPAAPGAGQVLVPLSARTADQLRECARRLQAHLERQPQVDLAQLAYTLQVGRDAHKHRVAAVVADVADLTAALRAVAAGQPYPGVFDGQGDARPGSGLAAHASAWAGGAVVSWASLYPAGTPRRCSLPGYPFARERYWIDAAPQPAAPADATFIATLLDKLMSDELSVDAAVSHAKQQMFSRDA